MSRWQKCVVQKGDNEIDPFLTNFLDVPNRNLLLIAGAGFDPRSTALSQRLAKLSKPNIKALLLRENRPNSTPGLRDRAEKNCAQIISYIPNYEIIEISVFAEDNAVIGGREIIRALSSVNFDEITDILLDASAISTGIYFPAAKFLCDTVHDTKVNLHLFVTEEPSVDHGIRGISCDAPSPLHAFRGKLGLDSASAAAKLWLPQFVPRRQVMFDRLFQHLGTDDVCPILPFPCTNPRLPDLLVEEYRESLSAWDVDFRNCVHAAENDPIDLYRTILRLDDTRQRIFAETGGSLLIISPTGSKVLSVGALLAAMERDLPVVLIESIGYEVDLHLFEHSLSSLQSQCLVHVWLEGEPYQKSAKEN